MENKKAIVTGGSRGIGKGIVLELASRGYDIVFSYHTGEEEAKEVVRRAEEFFRVRCGCFQAALQEHGAGEAFFRRAVEFLGGVDVLVNNAGTTRFANLLDLDEETFDLLVDLDFRNYIMMMRCGAGYMQEHGIRGSIINITSSRGERAYPGDGIYGACKAGINRAVESFALDVAPYGIRINNVAPGSIQVRTREDRGEGDGHMLEIYGQLGKRIPLGRMGRPGDIGKAVAYLASEDASYITGVTLRVDGGLILPGMPERNPDGAVPWGFSRRQSETAGFSEDFQGTERGDSSHVKY